MVKPPKNLRDFQALVEVVKALRGPDGCPWDKEQTPKSLTQYAIEEAHELAEAIENDHSQEEICEELGDVLLQVVLHAEIARQEDRFNITDVIEAIGSKMVRRHPHVFSNVEVSGSKEVLANWDEIKKKEKAEKMKTEGFNFNLPINLPALQKANKIGEKTKRHNFDWPDIDGVFAKVEEEIGEFKEAYSRKSKTEMESELGDVFFSLAQVARHLDIDPEQALRGTNDRFEKRFAKMYALADEKNLALKDMSTDELEKLWQKAKCLV